MSHPTPHLIACSLLARGQQESSGLSNAAPQSTGLVAQPAPLQNHPNIQYMVLSASNKQIKQCDSISTHPPLGIEYISSLGLLQSRLLVITGFPH
jgi:hypothetical protein